MTERWTPTNLKRLSEPKSPRSVSCSERVTFIARRSFITTAACATRDLKRLLPDPGPWMPYCLPNHDRSLVSPLPAAQNSVSATDLMFNDLGLGPMLHHD